MLTLEQPQEQPRNPFSHPFVRFVPDEGTGHYIESAVYNVQTGQRKLCWPVDGKEMVATGGWSWERPTAEQIAAANAKPEVMEEVPDAPISDRSLAPADHELAAEPIRRGPGRPRKNPTP